MRPPQKSQNSLSKRRSSRKKDKNSAQKHAVCESPGHLPTTACHGKTQLFTPPPFNLSFGSEVNSEMLHFMDQCTSAIFSTPLNSVKTPLSTGHNSKRPLFDLSNIQSPNYSESRKQSFLITPTKCPSNLQLSHWGIPSHVLDQYSKRGITTMFPWQADCLSLPGVLEGGNLVYSAPTSAGKTLVAELLALKCALELRKKVIFVLPFVSIAHEKSNYLQQVLEPSGVKVGGFMGSLAPPGGFASVDIAICTIEKANSLVNRLLEEDTAHQLGLVVVDELHMVGDSYRGYLLELLLTKLMYVSRKKAQGSTDTAPSAIQLVGMSATLSNLDTLANWLGAKLYHTDYRPVPLQEMVKIGPTLYDTDFKTLREFDPSQSLPGDEDDILLICREAVSKGHSVLIFCPTKSWCENLSHTLGQAKLVKVNQELAEGLARVCQQLKRTQVGLDPSLAKSIPNGVAFHHAGLTMDEREIVEGAYRQSLLKVLVATSTLSSGVNLPARLVIIRTPFFQRSLIDVLVYKQMVGRAGRKGVDQSGESILICKSSERSKIVSLLKAVPKPVKSALGFMSVSSSKREERSNLAAMKRALLEVISSGTVTTPSEIEAYVSYTLLYAEMDSNQSSSTKLQDIVKPTLEFLQQNEFISTRSQDQDSSKELSYFATQLGTATVASSLSPDEALVVFGDLLKARKNFVLESELHIIYLVTPVYVQNQWPSIDWYKYFCLWDRLPPAMRHVAETLGVRESFLAQAVQGRLPERTTAQRESLRVHRRFYTALALHDLVQEVPIVYVARHYGATKGLLQTLQGAAGTFAGMVTVFCNKLGWKNLELLMAQFQSRLLFGVQRELCDLVKISLLNGFRARVLYNAGFHSLPALATANPMLVESCLRSAVPFRSKNAETSNEKSSTWCAKLRRGLTKEQAAREIVAEAQKIISAELNMPITAWSHPTAHSTDKQVVKLSNIKLQEIRKSRQSPNQGENADEIGTKKPRVEVPAPSHQLPTVSESTSNRDAAKDQSSCEPSAVIINVKDPVPDSKLPLNVHPTPEHGAASMSNFSFFEDSLISFSPLVTPDCSMAAEQYDKETIARAESPEPLLTVPDSFVDVSLSLSFNAYELIDAACQAEGSTSSLFHSPKPPNNESLVTAGTTTSKGAVKNSTQVKPRPVDLRPHCDGKVALNTIAESPAEMQSDRAHTRNTENKTCEITAVAESPLDTEHKDITSALPPREIFKTPSRAVPTSSFTSSPLCLRELSSLCSSQLSQSGVTIIDVTSNLTLFETFVAECLEQSSLSFSIASTQTEQAAGIGCAVIQRLSYQGISLPGGSEQVVGIAFCWGELDVYYVSLCKSVETVSLSGRLEAMKKILTDSSKEQRLIAYDMKRHCKYLAHLIGVLPNKVTLDPKVGDWMLHPDQKEKTVHRMVLQYLPEQPSMAEDDDQEQIPLSNLATHGGDPQVQASAECVLASLLTSKIEGLLETEGLHKAFIEVEMPSLMILAKLELNGVGFSPEECTRLKDTLQRRIAELERNAYALANHTFSLTSPEDVAQVLFIELRLPYTGDGGKKTLGANTRRKRVTHMSTAKNVLEKITSLHPLPGIVLEWRRLSSTVSKMVFPLFKEAVTHNDIESIRIHASTQIHTATGRVTVSDPSLQMVPKEFEIGTKLSLQQPSLLSDSQYLDVCQQTSDVNQLPSSVCMRDVFVPFKGGVFLAADYSQLELRILAHMSGDEKLTKFLNRDGDVFRLIASEWLSLLPEQVTDKQRQETKQICYGMLYGIGGMALGEQLGIDENDASQFMESFKTKYPTMKKFISKTVRDCKENGYISTLLGRKRYLPGIHSTNVHARTQAERQAVNSTIQGSAADLVKTAMVQIDRTLGQMFTSTVLTCPGGEKITSGAYFVLQLHDELLYEVAEKDLVRVARIVKDGMENAMNLSVRFPVKVKVGPSWGKLDTYHVK